MLIEDISIELYLRDGSVEVVSSRDRLVSFNVIYELDSELEGVVGQISANELNISLLNTDSRYSVHNEASELYGLIGAGVVIKVKDKGVDRGTFIVNEWSSPRGGSNVANIRATDRLQSVLNSDVKVLDIDKNIILYDYLKSVLLNVGIGVEDIVIDESLKSKSVKFTITEGLKLSSLLNDIALSYDLYIYVDECNKVVVRSKGISGEAVHTLSDSVNVYALNTLEEEGCAYNKLNINYKMPYLGNVVEVLNVKELSVPIGISDSEWLQIEDSNLYDVDNVRVDSKCNIDIEGVRYNKCGVQLTFNNAENSDKLVDVIVRGRRVEVVDVVESISDDVSIDSSGVITLDVDVSFIQSKEGAVILRDKLWGRLRSKYPYIRLNILSNMFAYNLCDICYADIPSESMTYKGYIHSIRYDWSGGNVLRCEVGLKNTDI